MLDVAVVGAGPAGSTAATLLARAGMRTALVDRAAFPRDKCCGDGLTTAALRELADLGLDPEELRSWKPIDGVWMRSPVGRVASCPFPGDATYGAVVQRAELDAALVDLAKGSGAEVVDGCACVGASQDGSAVTLELADGSRLRSRYVVGADGIWSPLRRHLGLSRPGYRGEWHAMRQYFEDVGPLASEQLHVWFEPDLLPGYAWSFPLSGGRANFGFGVLRGHGYRVGDLGKVWPEVLARPHIAEVLGGSARPVGAMKAWPIPASIDAAQLGSGRVLFAGDAAAAADPLTGEGIGQAVLTGRGAAEAILAQGSSGSNGSTSADPREVQDAYRRFVRAELFADHRMSTFLGRIVAHRRGTSAAIAAADLSRWTRRNFARWLFEDEPRAALLTPRRWHRGFLSRPGPYER